MSCEICKSNKDVQIHHINPKVLGGEDSKDNFLNVCYKCHKLIHKLGILELDNINLLKNHGFEGYFIHEYCLRYEDKYSVKDIDYDLLLNFCNYLLNEAIYSKSKHGELIKRGLKKAKVKGKELGRPRVGSDNFEYPKSFYKYYKQWKNKDIKKVEFAKLINVSRPTLDLYINTYENKKVLKK